jgi:ubiquitin C-terminal hydrolase
MGLLNPGYLCYLNSALQCLITLGFMSIPNDNPNRWIKLEEFITNIANGLLPSE